MQNLRSIVESGKEKIRTMETRMRHLEERMHDLEKKNPTPQKQLQRILERVKQLESNSHIY